MRAPLDELPELFGVAIRGSDWGDLRSIVISLPAGTDLGPLMKGLPDDLCSCPHWGYVIKGRMRLSYADGNEEVLAAGDLFYLPAGHSGYVEEEFQAIEFSSPQRTSRCSTSSNATQPWHKRHRPESTL